MPPAPCEAGAVLTVAHLSDTHFGGHPDATARAQRVLAYLARMDPLVDLVLVTGDVADHGGVEEYAEARRVLVHDNPLPVPLLTCPGNHDARAAYIDAFGDLFGDDRQPGDTRPANHGRDVGGIRFLMLDSLIPARNGQRVDPGRLAPESLAWLRSQLAQHPDTPTVICLHHPPTTISISLMDPIRMENPDDLAAELIGQPQVIAVLTGHAHTMGVTTFAGLPFVVGGGIASTVVLDAEPYEPLTHDLPPSFAVHVIDLAPAPRLITHFRTVG